MSIYGLAIKLTLIGGVVFVIGFIMVLMSYGENNSKRRLTLNNVFFFGGFSLIVLPSIALLCFNLMTFEGDYKHVDTMKIVALQDSTQPSLKGTRMAFRSEDYIRVCYKRPDGNTQILKFPTDKVVFETTDKNFRVERFTYTYNNDFVDRSKQGEKDSRYKIYLPKNSIVEDFKVDLK